MMKRSAFNNKGLGMLMLVIMISMVALLASALGILGNAQAQEQNFIRMNARKKISDRIVSYLQSQAMMAYNVSNQNSPTHNPALRDCVATGEPSVDCPEPLSISFYQPLSETAAEKFIGSVDDPAYLEQHGDVCIPSSARDVSNCFFKSISKCSVACPGAQMACGMVKLLQCDIEVSVVGDSYLTKYVYLEKTNRFAATYAIRLSRDKKTFQINHE